MPTCEDTDGKNVYSKGSLTYTNNPDLVSAREDFCADENILIEAMCFSAMNDSMNSLEYECPNGCLDGTCKETAVTRFVGPIITFFS